LDNQSYSTCILLLMTTCPEKIIIFFDLDDSNNVQLDNGTILEQWKPHILNWISLKTKMNSNTRFALCGMSDFGVVLSEFTSNIDQLNRIITSVASTGHYETLDFDSIFETFASLVSAPKSDKNGVPEYVVRTIILYSRTIAPFWRESVPTKTITRLLSTKYFYLDVLHVTKSDSLLLAFLPQLQDRVKFIMTCSSCVEMGRSFGLLLAHPWIRREPLDQVNKI
jgi:hypothetical protein